MSAYQGNPRGEGRSFAIVVSRFNQHITEKLLEGACQALAEHGVAREDIPVAWVPGALELPLAVKRLAASGSYAAVIALGCVIQHETLHFQLVAEGATRGLLDASLETGVPVLHGVLACYDEQQALDRAGGKHGNKGYEAALGALEMAGLLEQLPPPAEGDFS
ncbi:MAG TPA: 6,7-dimethyl-8-ribityllumazine synthase [Dehalococcoidia bacterium]|nr:6,7-dimethyl-8-ribityllumazine synthase [Dehalococcoidia bacterium]